MNTIENLLNRIDVYNERIKNEHNIATKIVYLDELIQVASIIKKLNYIEYHSLLNENEKS